MEFIFVDSQEFREARQDLKKCLKYFIRHPFKTILTAIVGYFFMFAAIILLG